MVEGLVFLAGVAGFEILAVRYGKDSRDGDDWVDHSGHQMSAGVR
jgi:hypothetical protein